ncbi:MAG: hypothetical protein A3K13_08490 [Gemmatimonadetes bacterium RIFCSPLOWO2_12_FULL_68_9]|nr:MAG: hypothetical protein A3K13_08490 [Gemmatimonadetes bacterium RIFCSPLOWO2_12_FULL_68_9]
MTPAGLAAQVGAAPPAWSAISAGGSHTCAIAEDAAAYCWGRNDRGALGIGTTLPAVVPTAVRMTSQ